MNKEKYPRVNFNILQNNFNILTSIESKNIELYSMNIRTMPELEFHIDYKEMYNLYFTENQYWLPGHRNEINDAVQINILKHLVDFIPGANCCLFTDDINMIKKTENYKSNFKIYTHINKKGHFWLKTIDVKIQKI